MESEARESASQKIRELGDDPDSYSIQVEEDGDAWRVIFLPLDRRIRGGGYEVTVDKRTKQVQDVRRYQ